MNVRRRYLNFGVFLLCVGAVPLAVQTGLLNAGGASDIARLWPLILIGIGLGIIVRLSSFQALGGVVVAATVGLLIGSALAGGAAGAVGCIGGPASGSTVTRSGSFTDPLSPGQVSIDLSCADLTSSQGSTNDWTVQATTDQPPTINADGELRLTSSRNVPFSSGRENWIVTLPNQLSTVYFTLNASSANLTFGPGALALLSLDLNAGDAHLNLGQADLSHGPLNATLNAASATIILPTSGTGATGTLHLNASSLNLCADPGLALHISYDGTLSSDNFAAAGLTTDGHNWTTPNADLQRPNVYLDLSANVSSISLDRSGGCSQ